jgi:hypothetical protein
VLLGATQSSTFFARLRESNLPALPRAQAVKSSREAVKPRRGLEFGGYCTCHRNSDIQHNAPDKFIQRFFIY